MRRVVKVGGSLLWRPDLPHQLQQWFGRQNPADNLVVVGGGQVVDAVRRADKLSPGDQAEVHWKCVALLEQTLTDFASRCDWNLVLTKQGLAERIAGRNSTDRPTLVAVRAFYDRQTSIDVPLDWRTTSDTIAAILAISIAADELVLLKSCRVDPADQLSILAERGIVDQALSSIAEQIRRVRVEPLR